MQERQLIFQKPLYLMRFLTLLHPNFNIAHGHAVSLTINKFLNFIYFNQEKNSSSISISERFKILFKLTNTYNIID